MALIDNINDGFKQLATLIKGKVNKTDVIAVAQGGTGANNMATARSNLGLGTAATANITTSSTDSTVNRVLKVGDFGYGNISQFDISSDWNNPNLTDKFNQMSNGNAFYYVNLGNVPAAAYGSALMRSLTKEWSGYTGDRFWGLSFAREKLARISILQDGTTKLYTQNVYTVLDTGTAQSLDVTFKSLSSGAASYAKGWRKLTATLPSQAGEITVAHGVTTVETVQAKVTNSDGIIIYNNDIDPANQFYVRVNGANLVLGVTANSTKVFGKTVTIYVGEEL